MKKNLLLIALLGIGAAWMNRPLQASGSDNIHTYNFVSKSTDGTKMYYSKDLTAAGYIKGLDYDCSSATAICTFMGNPALAHFDFSGFWFYTSQVPVSGIDDSGYFLDLR